MVAALERGNIDAYAVWEPWVTRGLAAVKNIKVLRDQEGILEQGVYIYMNLAWIRKNPEQAEGFMRALIEATDVINKDRKRAAKDVSDFLKSLDPQLVEQLMTKLRFEMVLDDFTISLFRLAENQLKQQGKLTKPLDLGAFVYPDLLKKVQPKSVNYKPCARAAQRSRPASGDEAFALPEPGARLLRLVDRDDRLRPGRGEGRPVQHGVHPLLPARPHRAEPQPRRDLAAVLALQARSRARSAARRISHRPIRRPGDAGRGNVARGAGPDPALPHAQLPALSPRLHRPAELRVPGRLQSGDPGRGQQLVSTQARARHGRRPDRPGDRRGGDLSPGRASGVEPGVADRRGPVGSRRIHAAPARPAHPALAGAHGIAPRRRASGLARARSSRARRRARGRRRTRVHHSPSAADADVLAARRVPR